MRETEMYASQRLNHPYKLQKGCVKGDAEAGQRGGWGWQRGGKGVDVPVFGHRFVSECVKQ